MYSLCEFFCHGSGDGREHPDLRVLGGEPRLKLVEGNPAEGYLRAEATSLVFHFVDDIELQVMPNQRSIEACSASHVGYWDFGVNRRRIERLHERLDKSRNGFRADDR